MEWRRSTFLGMVCLDICRFQELEQTRCTLIGAPEAGGVPRCGKKGCFRLLLLTPPLADSTDPPLRTPSSLIVRLGPPAPCRFHGSRRLTFGEPDLILFRMAGRLLTAPRHFYLPRCSKMRATWRVSQVGSAQCKKSRVVSPRLTCGRV